MTFQIHKYIREMTTNTADVQRAVNALRKGVQHKNAKFHLTSQQVTERTLTYLTNSLEYCPKSIHGHEILKKVQYLSEILKRTARNMLDDETECSQVIIQNATLRVLKLVREQLEGIDETGEESFYDKSVLTYRSFFGNAMESDNKFDNITQLNGSYSGTFENSQ